MRGFWLGLAMLLGMTGPVAADPPDLARIAAGYALYDEDVLGLGDAEIPTPEALDAALDRAARHPPDTLTQGWIAYGALSAAQAPAFVSGVRARVRTTSRAAVLRRLSLDLSYARHRPAGANDAITMILQTNAVTTCSEAEAANHWTALGDSLRLQAWAAAPETDRDARLLHLQNLATPSLAGGTHILRFPPLTPSPPIPLLVARADRSDLIDRMLTLAALRIIDTAPEARVNALLSDDATTRCLNLSRLQLRQCVSVTQFPYENAFCLARHGLSGPSGCFALAR